MILAGVERGGPGTDRPDILGGCRSVSAGEAVGTGTPSAAAARLAEHRTVVHPDARRIVSWAFGDPQDRKTDE